MRRNSYNKLNYGDHLFYACFNDNPNIFKALVNTTRAALSPYNSFLNEAMDAERKKGSYEVDWKYINSSFYLNIQALYSKYKIEKIKPVFRIYLEDTSIIEEDRNKVFFDSQDKILRFDKNELKVEKNWVYIDNNILPIDDEIIEFNNQKVKYEVQNIKLKKGDILNSNTKKYKIENIEYLDDAWNILLKTNDYIKELKYDTTFELKFNKYNSNFERLYDGEDEFIFEKISTEYSCEELPKNEILIDDNKIEYTWNKIKSNSTKDIKIQLIDKNTDDNEKAISEYFFEDEVKDIYQGENKNSGFEIRRKIVEDKILILKNPRNNLELKENEPIKIKVEIGNLNKQRDAIKLLNDSPVKEQRNLIKLFEDKQRGEKWKDLEVKEINSWYILKDKNYDGTIDQREFVKKAIATEDFAILEGPPGSGKTTTILELILQLAKEGKKILLSASTHVAIDNVLERIKEKDIENLVEPLRVGREGSVGEDIEKYLLDKKIETYIGSGFDSDLSQKLVIDSSNLVCGTTMGINQFPPIKDRVDYENGKRKNSILPIDTMFDVMIIDESSKTTFQEFLVPALLAKKWILVGDIKQLSPYIEQTHIVHNLNVQVHKDTQRAIRVVFEALFNNINPYIIEVSKNEEREIKKYLNYWENQDNNPYIGKIISYSDEEDLFKLFASDIIFIQEGSWDRVKETMPKTHIVILKKEKDDDEFWFSQKLLQKKGKLPSYRKINNKTSKTNDPLEYKEFFKDIFTEQTWAEAIAWRMIRVYERRMLKNPSSYYEESYKLLKPVEKDNFVDRIYNMTLPSILESIQIGNGESHRNTTTITDGFDKRDLIQRHEVLKTQHRMHEDISKFSRKEFYTANGVQALQDARTINRDWGYAKYSSRAVWINTSKNINANKSDRVHNKEVDVIINEIKDFISFSKQNPKNNDNEPWSIAVLTYYRPQEALIREKLRVYCHLPNKMSKFHKDGVDISLYTVDKFQGMEADIVFLSMVRGKSVGFMDNINRLNVALTRAKYQRVIVGDQSFFQKQEQSDELRTLAQNGGI